VTKKLKRDFLFLETNDFMIYPILEILEQHIMTDALITTLMIKT
jgi:hypothetical protein